MTLEEDLSPCANQMVNLNRMTEILRGNEKSTALARSLWEFFNFELICTVQPPDGTSSRCRIDPWIEHPSEIGKVPRRIALSIRDTERKEETLVHELLHAELIRLGYPTFFINEQTDSEKFRLAGKIINNAGHVIMKPIYLSLGYSEERFLGDEKPLSDCDARIIADLAAMDFSTPDSYWTSLSTYLHRESIRFEKLPLTRAHFRKQE
jgi:hypothetical protein